MMKGYIVQQQQQEVLEENMSNLTCASGEASVSSAAGGTNYSQQYFSNPPAQAQPVKRKRNEPGNPDPDAEVIALSPKTLMTTNRFVCEICNKGFQRDQNLQLHRRGHNLPWKLKQRTSKEVRKKVYVCPEVSCVHHDPSRALGDLTGIKKHFYRKHGEKKWKCDKCSKRYAVQSDWKAHSKTCGTKEYRCDCGTLFSRRDSFITHRAFCDALAEESSRAAIMGANTFQPGSSHTNLQVTQFNPHDIQAFSLKQEQHQRFTPLKPDIPPWLAIQPMLGAGAGLSSSSSSIFSPSLTLHENPTPIPTLDPTLPPYHPTTVLSPHMSATALLQKAAQMGATLSNKPGSSSAPATTTAMRPHQQTHVSADFVGSTNNNSTTAGFGLNLSSREEVSMGSGFIHGSTHHAAESSGAPPPPSLLLQGMMNSLSSPIGFESTSFDDIAFSGVLNAKKKSGTLINESFSKTTAEPENGTGNNNDHESRAGGSTHGEALRRDFLAL
ncbi:hypothetical protein ES332_D10G068000v1 [Gossypium tomentosum]|uniref:C2H2-type domain-containing protein n=1 Tax=Gossypium tomentosum TaxID=34277 RepID=A0A5D2J0J2_GOSTO|nr:hypothetical protein ES332_D10G068000v1 [Gossypium tomentosum]